MSPYITGPLTRAVQEALSTKQGAKERDDRYLLRQIDVDFQIAVNLLLHDADSFYREHIKEVIASIEASR